jgi:hypothetical protein
MNAAIRALEGLGWRWSDGGAVVSAKVNGNLYEVFVPLGHIVVRFDDELSRVGCALPTAVGACATVGGFWGSIKRAYKKTTRAVKRVVPKAIKRAAKRVRKFAAKHVIPILRTAKGIIQSRAAQAIVATISTAVPVLAPAGAAVLAAQEALRHIDMAADAAKKIEQGVKLTRKLKQQLVDGHKAKSVLQVAARQAKAGDKQARQLFGAIQQLQG